MNIGIIGGGNIGTALAGELTHYGNDVFLFTSKPEQWHNPITVFDEDCNLSYQEDIKVITDNLDIVCQNCRIIIITLPSNAFKGFSLELERCIQMNTKIIVLPGTGGAEYVFRNCIDKSCTLIGLKRVHAICRVKQYGSSVTVSGRRKEGLHACSFPKINNSELTKLINDIFHMETHILPNYLCVTLTPSNPILHTSRLYCLFKDCERSYSENAFPLFYADWDMESSNVLLLCDKELQSFKSKLKEFNLDDVISLLEHYESIDAISLTNKIRGIKSLHNLISPSIKKNDKYYIDWDSRYFKADYPNGLIILKAIALLIGVETPTMDKIIAWYQNAISKEYFLPNGNFGKDIIECNIPQNYGIMTYEDFVNYYK